VNPELILRVAIPTSLRDDVLHVCHTDMQAGHQGVNRTFERLRQEYHWPRMFQTVQQYVRTCVDCSTGKGVPPYKGTSPGNIVARFPFHVVSNGFHH